MKTLLSLMMICLLGNALAQNDIQDLEYAAYLKASKTLWKQAVEERQKLFNRDQSNDKKFDLVMAQYGLLNVTMKDRDEDLFDDFVDITIQHLEELIDSNENWAEPKALLSSIYGLKMGYSPWKGIYLGSKSSSLIEEALKIDSNSSLVWKVEGSSKLFTPTMFGGDQEAAVKAFEKSVQLYELGNTTKNWMYLDALAWLGQAYQRTGKTTEAIAVYEKAMAIESEFAWVKFALLPSAKK